MMTSLYSYFQNQDRIWLISFFLGGILCLLITPTNLQAQGGVTDPRFVIEKEQEIKLEPVSKSFEKIKPINPQKTEPLLKYQFLSTNPLKDQLQIALSPPNEYKEPDPFQELDRPQGYLRLGGGNYRTTYFEGFFKNSLKEKLDYGIHARHLNSQFGEVADRFSGTGENLIKVFAKYALPKSVLRASLGYQRNNYHFYGYDPSTIENLNRDTLNQVFNRIFLNLDYANADPEAKLSYQAGLRVMNLSDEFDNQELQLGVLGEISKILSNDSRIGFKAEAYYMPRETAILSQDRVYAQFEPSYQLQIRGLNLDLGLRAAFSNDELVNVDDFFLYPLVRANYRLSEAITLKAGFEGSLERNSLESFTRQNPFLDSDIELAHTDKEWEVSAGGQFLLPQNIRLEIEGSYAQFENLPFFTNNMSDSARFLIVYEGLQNQRFSLKAQASYEWNKKLSIQLESAFFSYNLNALEEPWHQPRFLTKVFSKISPIEKLNLYVNLWAVGGIKAKNFESFSNETIHLETIVDLSLEADYAFNNDFLAFFKLNNVLNNDYQRYLYYRQQRLNFLIGLAYVF